jgi:hypothetical protein
VKQAMNLQVLRELVECLQDVITAQDDLRNVEFDLGEAHQVDINITASSDAKGITFVHRLPLAAVLAGLRTMQTELAKSVKAVQIELEVTA